MKSSKTAVALALATLASTWSATGLADDQGQEQGNGHGADTSTRDAQPLPPPTSSSSTPSKSATDAVPGNMTPSTTTSDPSRAATTTTTQAAYDPSVGAEQREEVRPNVRVLVPSALVFAGAYGASAIIGSINDRDSDHKLAIPLVGPWLDLADRNCDVNPCDNEGLSKAVIIASGVLQAAGVAGVIASLFIPETRTTRAAVAKPHVDVLPVSIGRGGAGLGAVGVF